MPETMKIRSTNVSEGTGLSVEISIADSADPDAAREAIRFRVVLPSGQAHWRLAAIQKAALQRVRDAIANELQRTTSIANQRDE